MSGIHSKITRHVKITHTENLYPEFIKNSPNSKIRKQATQVFKKREDIWMTNMHMKRRSAL